IKDAVATGNGEYLSILRKQLFISLPHLASLNLQLKCLSTFCNAKFCYQKVKPTAVRMGCYSELERWCWENVEIDLFQENRNCEMKKLIKVMGANKMDKVSGRASKGSGGMTKIVETFEDQ
ncbi:Hypothetical predicted protein, partial [Paramuricea clavata]